MKLLLVLLAVAAGIWLWRSGRSNNPSLRAASAPAKNSGPQAMIACSVCQVHVPRQDALTGRLGTYCSVAHRQQAEG